MEQHKQGRQEWREDQHFVHVGLRIQLLIDLKAHDEHDEQLSHSPRAVKSDVEWRFFLDPRNH